MHRKFPIIRALIALVVVLISPVFAHADPAPDCPASAEQALFNMQLQVQAGAVTNGNDVFNLANQALTLCADRSEVQGLATQLFSAVGNSVSANADRFAIWSKAYETARNNHNAFSFGASPIVKLPDGTDHTLYPYSDVSALMTDKITAHLLLLALEDHTHPIFAPDPLAECPYNEKQNRVRDEAQGLRKTGAQTYAEGGAEIALARIERLRSVCTEQAGYLTLMLAELHGAAAYKAKYAKQHAAGAEHAQKSLDYYLAFKTMNVSGSDDKFTQEHIGPRIKDAEEALADYRLQ